MHYSWHAFPILSRIARIDLKIFVKRLDMCLSAFLAGTLAIVGAAQQPAAATPLMPLQADNRSHQPPYLELIYSNGQAPQLVYRNQENDGDEKTALHLECKRNQANTTAPPIKGAWIWKSSQLLSKPEAARQFFLRASSHGIQRIYLQLVPNLEQQTALLRLAREQGIEVYALTGSPDDIDHPQAVLATIDTVLDYNRHHDLHFSGIQFDIEPYLLPDFQLQEQQVLSRYLKLVRVINTHLGGQMPLSFAVPFWFDQKSANGANLMASVIQTADQIAIMSYRTSLEQILAVSNNALCLGEQIGKPVYLGIELTRIPDEIHFISKTADLLPYLQSTNNGADLTREEITRIAQSMNIRQTFIPGTRLSFYPDEERAFAITGRTIPYQSFAGWMVNGLDGVWLDD